MKDDTARLADLISIAKSGYEFYKSGFDKMTEAYLLYLDENKRKDLQKRNKSQLFIPKINSKAKRIMDALSETYFNTDKFAKLEEYINSDPNVIEKWQEAIDHYAELIKLYKTFQPIFLKATFLGTAVAKIYWANERVYIEEVELENIYFDKDARSYDDLRYIVNKIYMTKDDIAELLKKKIYNNKDIKDILDEAEPYKRFEIHDIYEFKDGTWHLSTLYEDSVILRENIKLIDGQPFVFGYMLPQIKRFNEDNFVCVYGEPPLASMLPLQEEMNNIRNSFIDGVNQHLKPKLILEKNAQVSRTDIETIGQPVYTANPTSVNIIPPPNINAAGGAIQILDNEMSEVSGVSPQQNGINPNRKETATMASIMSSEGSVRLQGYIRTFNETFFEPVFERLAWLVWKYGDAMFFAGYSRREVPSYKISLNTGIGALNKEVQKQGLLEVSSLIKNHFSLCMGVQDMEGAMRMKNADKEIIKQILPLYGIKNVETILGDENEFNRAFGASGGDNTNQNGQAVIGAMPEQGIFNGGGMGVEQILNPN